MNTTTSRRAVLAGFAVAAPAMVLALPTPAFPKADSPPPDPIFALIEKHRRLQADAIALNAALVELEETLPDDVMREPRVATNPQRDGKATVIKRTDDYIVIRHEFFGLTGKLHYVNSLTQLFQSVRDIPEDHHDAWLADREAAFKRDRRALRRRQRKAGLPQLRDRSAAARDEAYLAGQELLSTPPTTLAGVIALLRYCVECHETTDDVVGPDGDDPYRLLASIDTALQSIAVQS